MNTTDMVDLLKQTTIFSALSEDELLELVCSAEWQVVRANIHGSSNAGEPEIEARDAIQRHRDFRDGLQKVADVFTSTDLTLSVVPGKWRPVAQATLGALFVTSDSLETSSVVLDWAAREIADSSGNGRQELTAMQTHLLTMLVVAGDVGVSLAEVRQSFAEFDRLEAGSADWPQPSNGLTHLDDSERDRFYVAKHRLTERIYPFQLRILTRKGRWVLDSQARVLLSNTPWTLSSPRPLIKPPVSLAPQLEKLWQALQRYFPSEAKLEVLVTLMGKSNSEQCRKAIARVVYKLRKQLERSDTRWRIHRDYSGNYRLVHLP